MSNRIEPAAEQDFIRENENGISLADRFKDISYIIWMQNINTHRKNIKEELLPVSKIELNRFNEKTESKICSIL